jgi:hypothetical protein
MTLKEACELWINRDFSSIPSGLIKKAYHDDFEELELLTSEYPTLDFPSGWGFLFHPECSLDEDWIKNNIDIVEKCGFLIYQSEDCGLLLAIDGCGYDFHSKHWQPLYRARGLKWHSPEDKNNNK